MLEARGDLGLARESTKGLGVEGQRLLHGDHALEQRIGGERDATHAATRDLVAGEVTLRRLHRAHADRGAGLVGQRGVGVRSAFEHGGLVGVAHGVSIDFEIRPSTS